MPIYGLFSQERLKSTKSISRIFTSGKSLHKFPIVLRYHVVHMSEYLLDHKDAVHLQVAFTVSKRLFKRAVDRNRIKRLMREAHRHHILAVRENAKSLNIHVEMIYIFTGKKLPSLEEVTVAEKHLLYHLERKLG